MSDAPTQRFDPAPTPPGGEPAGEPEKKSRALLITLIVIGAVLLAGVIALVLFLLLGRGNATALASPSPTPTTSITASASPKATTTPASTPAPTATSNGGGGTGGGGGGTASGPKINSFTANPTVVACPAPDAPVKPPTTVSFRWSTSDVDHVEFGLIDTGGNYQLLASNLPPQGTNDSDLPGSDGGGWAYPCSTDKVTYVLKASGSGQTKTATVLVDDRTYN